MSMAMSNHGCDDCINSQILWARDFKLPDPIEESVNWLRDQT